jgi:hypothetical protein
MRKMNVVKVSLFLVLVVSVFGEAAFARDLVSAANTAANTAKSVAQAAAVLGVVSGGVVMQVPGAAEWGKRIAVGGIVGGICAFGAPSFYSLLHTVFGGM